MGMPIPGYSYPCVYTSSIYTTSYYVHKKKKMFKTGSKKKNFLSISPVIIT